MRTGQSVGGQAQSQQREALVVLTCECCARRPHSNRVGVEPPTVAIIPGSPLVSRRKETRFLFDRIPMSDRIPICGRILTVEKALLTPLATADPTLPTVGGSISASEIGAQFLGTSTIVPVSRSYSHLDVAPAQCRTRHEHTTVSYQEGCGCIQ